MKVSARAVLLALAMSAALLAVATAGSESAIRRRTAHHPNRHGAHTQVRHVSAKRNGRKLMADQSIEAVQTTQAVQKTDKAQHEGDHGYNGGYNGGYNSGYNSGYTGGIGSAIGNLVGGIIGGALGESRNNYGAPDSGHYDYHPPAYQPHGDHYDYVPGHYRYHEGEHYDGPLYGGKRRLMADQATDATEAIEVTSEVDNAESANKADHGGWGGNWGGNWGSGFGHYDYHAPSYVPHGNHYDYVPGHYDYHQGSHWGNGWGWGRH